MSHPHSGSFGLFMSKHDLVYLTEDAS
ncbi:MAG: GNAT family N-acetyltransferase, partial [Agrobacterium fabrum]